MMMDVLHMANTKSTFSSPQEGPIDLTKHKPTIHNSSQSSQYPWNHEIYRLYPHLRFGNSLPPNPSILSQTRSKDESKCPNSRSSPVIQYVPHPKKRPYTEISESLPEPKKRKLCTDDTAFSASSSDSNRKGGRYRGSILSQNYNQPLGNPAQFSSPPVPYSYSTTSLMPENEEMMGVVHSKNALNHSALKETESLMAAVQHSQMLYYTYCTQLFRNLQTKQFLHEQEHYSQMYMNVSNERPCQTFETTLSQIAVPATSTQSSTVVNGTTASSDAHMMPRTPTADCCSPTRSTCSPPQPSSTSEERNYISAEGECHTILGRRRAPRALTGKHVRPGTGASPSTLLTLRQKLAEKRRSNEHMLPKNRKSLSSKMGRGSRGRRK